VNSGPAHANPAAVLYRTEPSGCEGREFADAAKVGSTDVMVRPQTGSTIPASPADAVVHPHGGRRRPRELYHRTVGGTSDR
jgi:hypothetical protein